MIKNIEKVDDKNNDSPNSDNTSTVATIHIHTIIHGLLLCGILVLIVGFNVQERNFQ